MIITVDVTHVLVGQYGVEIVPKMALAKSFGNLNPRAVGSERALLHAGYITGVGASSTDTAVTRDTAKPDFELVSRFAASSTFCNASVLAGRQGQMETSI